MKYLGLISLIIMLLLVGSCDNDSFQPFRKRRFAIYSRSVALDFNLGSVYGILDKVHNDYLQR